MDNIHTDNVHTDINAVNMPTDGVQTHIYNAEAGQNEIKMPAHMSPGSAITEFNHTYEHISEPEHAATDQNGLFEPERKGIVPKPNNGTNSNTPLSVQSMPEISLITEAFQPNPSFVVNFEPT